MPAEPFTYTAPPSKIRRKWRLCPACRTRVHLFDDGWRCTTCRTTVPHIQALVGVCACGCGARMSHVGQKFRRGHGPTVPVPSCSIDGCEQGRYRRSDYCNKHRPRASSVAAGMSAIEKFEHFTPKRGDDCWIWHGRTRAVSGYAVLYVDGKQEYAHRWSYEHFIGPIPAGLLVRHSCDTPLCVNPAHLSVGTDADNARDKVERGRHPRGERAPSAVLTVDAVREIRERRARGEPYSSLSARFGVSATAIVKVAKGDTWRHVS